MSLKGLHVVFLVVAVALLLTTAWWLRQEATAFAIACLAFAAGLIAYGGWFLMRRRDIDFL